MDTSKIDREKIANINRACEMIGANQVMYSDSAMKQMLQMVREVKINDELFRKIVSTEQKRAVQAGFVAEVGHKETFNLDAIVKNKNVRAVTDHDNRWYDAGFKKNDNPDIIVLDAENHVLAKAQLKYYKNGKATANALREIKDGQVKYNENDQFLVAADKVDATKTAAKKTQQWEQGKANPRETVIDATQQVYDKTTGQMQVDGVKSKEITSRESKEMAKNGTDSETRKNYINKYENQSTIQQITKAGLSAAAITAIISGITNTVTYVSEVKNGNISPEEAVVKIASNTLLASVDSAVKASLSTGVISTLVRKEILSSNVNPIASGGIFTAVGVCVDFAKDIVLFGADYISEKELKERTAKNLVFAPASFIGSSIGTSIATSLGAGSLAGVLGGIPGGAIATIALQIAITNGIEKPYQELLESQEQITESFNIFNNALHDIDASMQNIDCNILEAINSFMKIEQRKIAIQNANIEIKSKQKTITKILEDF